mmetsp:Transcript_14599/g.1321  ORF Transcript_14599/g.1321 Transcript_14599/m.1321 type:complete len:116 (-) Transcript_14599:436-783(-)
MGFSIIRERNTKSISSTESFFYTIIIQIIYFSNNLISSIFNSIFDFFTTATLKWHTPYRFLTTSRLNLVCKTIIFIHNLKFHCITFTSTNTNTITRHSYFTYQFVTVISNNYFRS